ncbi:TniQ family protein [Dactylosporangium sp. NPDC005572]|uniref:TniQ family protein n=1 Tax=Dactylosporangium sp. NPDC005572 TaxID=3156889 RepID=UPI0033A1A412
MNIRALPIGLAPVTRELLGSYLHRLADANHVTIASVSQLLGTGRRYRRGDDDATTWTTHTVSALAALTGYPPTTLTQALPALRPLAAVAPLGRPGSGAPRVACRYCMASKGIHGLVIQRAASYEPVCLRHQRWLHGPEQHPLHALPELCSANRRHRRLLRQHDAATLDTAHARAQQLTQNWFHADDQHALQRRWTDRLNQLCHDPAADPYRPSRHRVEIATYHETVLLTTVFATEHHAAPGPVLPRKVTGAPDSAGSGNASSSSSNLSNEGFKPLRRP